MTDAYTSTVIQAQERFKRPPGGQPPLDPPGPPPHDSGMSDRVVELEKKVDRHLLFVLGAFAAGFLFLTGLIINRTDLLGDKIAAISTDVAVLKSDVGTLRAQDNAGSIKAR